MLIRVVKLGAEALDFKAMTPGALARLSLWICGTLSPKPVFLPLPAIHPDRAPASPRPDSVLYFALHQIKQLVPKSLHVATQVDHTQTFILLSQLLLRCRPELP